MIYSEKFQRDLANKYRAAWAKVVASNAQKVEENERLEKQLKAAQDHKVAENESLKKQLAESKTYAEQQAKLAEDGKKFGEWQEGLVSENKGRADRLEEELRQVKGQLKSATSHAKAPKPDEQPNSAGHEDRCGRRNPPRIRVPFAHIVHPDLKTVVWRDIVVD